LLNAKTEAIIPSQITAINAVDPEENQKTDGTYQNRSDPVLSFTAARKNFVGRIPRGPFKPLIWKSRE
jgi:hypothetical protein